MQIINVEILKNGYSKREQKQILVGSEFRGRSVSIEYKKTTGSSRIYRDIYNKENKIIYSDSFMEEVK